MFSPTLIHESKILPGVRFTVHRMGFGRRTDLDFLTLPQRQSLRELEADYPEQFRQEAIRNRDSDKGLRAAGEAGHRDAEETRELSDALIGRALQGLKPPALSGIDQCAGHFQLAVGGLDEFPVELKPDLSVHLAAAM